MTSLQSLAASVTPTIATGQSLTIHTVTAAVLGDGLSSIAVWILQLIHLDPPASVSQGITAIAMVAASWIMQRMSA